MAGGGTAGVQRGSHCGRFPSTLSLVTLSSLQSQAVRWHCHFCVVKCAIFPHSSLPGEGGLEERGLSVLFSGIGDSSVLHLDGLKVTVDNDRCWEMLALGSLLEVSGILCVGAGVSH